VEAVLVDGTTLTADLRAAAGSRPLLSLGPGAGTTDVLAPGGPAHDLTVRARPDDIALLAFTSGSTGRPKGCAFTYRALTAHWAWQPRMWGPVARELAEAFERYLLFGTLASMVVFEFLAPCLLGGGTAVIPDDDGRPLFPRALHRHRITGSIITVPRLGQLLEVLGREPVAVDGLRALMVSGSPLTPDRLAAALDRLGPVIFHGYGQTEAGSISILTPHDVATGGRPVLASVGRPHPGTTLSVRDAQDRELPPGHHGEIHVRGPSLMSGYWEQDDETRSTLVGGWLRTQDRGFVDGDGYVHLVGRSRDVVMVNAMVVYAGAVERVLAAHPDVDEAYVVAVPDERTGEAVHAFVVARGAGGVPDPGELRARVRAELGDDSVPAAITFIPGAPLAATGKPDKAALPRHTPPSWRVAPGRAAPAP
jgi:acyl-CoA synthetase (AMP-forming)/AMP-acid ligase II